MANKQGNSVYDINRPVHLARSSAFIEKARRQFQECAGKVPPKQRLVMLDNTLYYLQAALEHAALAAKSSRTSPLEESHVAFIRLLVVCLYSARLLLDNEEQLNDHKSPLWQFLHRSGKAQTAVQFARSGQQWLGDVEHLFQVSQAPIDDLRESLLKDMEPAARARYKLAFDNLRAHLARGRAANRAERFFQTFWPVLGMKSG